MAGLPLDQLSTASGPITEPLGCSQRSPPARAMSTAACSAWAMRCPSRCERACPSARPRSARKDRCSSSRRPRAGTRSQYSPAKRPRPERGPFQVVRVGGRSSQLPNVTQIAVRSRGERQPTRAGCALQPGQSRMRCPTTFQPFECGHWLCRARRRAGTGERLQQLVQAQYQPARPASRKPNDGHYPR